MSETRKQILQMLQNGTLSTEQALALLEAVDEGEEPEVVHSGEVIDPAAPPPDMARFRRFWQIPFFITLGFLLMIGLWLRSLYQASEGSLSLGIACLGSLFVLAFGLTAVAFMSRRSTWLHVRVKERGGKRIAISLPLPLGLASWGLELARSFTPAEQRQNLDMAADFLAGAKTQLNDLASDPVMINVEDKDGDHVQIFIG
jgi:hypothetical protein